MPRLTDAELRTLIALARLGDDANAGTIRKDVRANGKRLSVAGVYAAIDRLLRLRLARAWMSEPRPQPGGRGRWHYRLTADGRAWLLHEHEQSRALWRGVPTGDGDQR